jgi:hypothetical protein
MRYIYFSFAVILFLSCSTKIRYVGNTYPATNKVEVFVTEKSIKQPFDYIGKGYVAGFGPKNPEKIAAKSIQKARKMGADAILINDYYMPYTGTAINTVYTTDTVSRGIVRTGTTTVSPTVTTGYQILFVKYRSK